jgi:hypothetical protein
MRLRHLIDTLDETGADLERSEEDDTWASMEDWAIPRLSQAIEGLRDLLRPPQLRRLCAQSRAVPDLTHEPLTLSDPRTQDPPTA